MSRLAGFYRELRDPEGGKSAPESIHISSHEPDLCPNFTLSTECRLAAMVAFFFFRGNQTVMKLSEQIGYYVSVMVP